MARPKETDEQKVKKVYPDAVICTWDWHHEKGGKYYILCFTSEQTLSKECDCSSAAWSDALTQIRKSKIKAAKDKRKQAQPTKVKEIKKHTMCTMYPTDKAMIVKGFGSVQKFLDSKVNEYKLTIKTN